MANSNVARKLRLNGWQRMGVALSVVWMLLVAGRGAWEFTHLSNYYGNFYVADTAYRPALTLEEPDAQGWLSPAAATGIEVEHHFEAGRVLMAMFGPVLLFWILAYGMVFAFRWIAKGFERDRA